MIPNINSIEYKNAISVQQMRDSDRYTIEHFVESKELMYRAAMGVFQNVDWAGKKVAIFTGSGNNAGDGYALASILKEHAISASLILTSQKFSEDGSYYFEKAKAHHVPIYNYPDHPDLSEYDILVDCLLGTGFQGTPRQSTAEVIRKINASGKYTVSVDINSGMNGDTGEADIAVCSDLTISIGYYKKGLFLGKAPKLIKEMINVDIGIVLIT